MNSRWLFKVLHLVNGRGNGRRAAPRRTAHARLDGSALFGIWQIGLFGGKGKFVSSVQFSSAQHSYAADIKVLQLVLGELYTLN